MTIGNFIVLFLYGVFQRFLWIFARFYRVGEAKHTSRAACSVKHKVACLILSKDGAFNENILDKLKGYDVFLITNNEKISRSDVKVVHTRNAKNKAGSINIWLEQYGDNYDFFAIFDCDSDIDYYWVEKMLRYFGDDNVAFVQSYIKAKSGWFRKGVETFFKSRIPEYFLSCGHNVMFRTKAVKEIGGFPETMGEDFLVSLELWEKGYKSVLARDCISYEENPESFTKFVLRDMKWSSIEKLYIKGLGRLFRLNIPLLKKLEVFFDWTRSVISTVCMLLILALPFVDIDETAFFLMYLLFGIVPFCPETIIFSPALLFSTSVGFISGLGKDLRNFIPTKELDNSMWKERTALNALWLFAIAGCIYNILVQRVVFVSAFLLVSFLISIILFNVKSIRTSTNHQHS